jgi:hypothetical protein
MFFMKDASRAACTLDIRREAKECSRRGHPSRRLLFVPAFAQKYTMGPQAVTCANRHQTCGCNELRSAGAEGQLSAPAVWSERAFASSFRSPETKSAHLKFSPLSDHTLNMEVSLMYARNVTFNLKSNSHSDYTRTFENEILPLLRKQKGFKEEITLTNPNSQETIAISLWENKANADAYNTNTYPEVLRTFGKMIDGTPRVQTFDNVVSTSHNVLQAV